MNTTVTNIARHHTNPQLSRVAKWLNTHSIPADFGWGHLYIGLKDIGSIKVSILEHEFQITLEGDYNNAVYFGEQEEVIHWIADRLIERYATQLKTIKAVK